MTLPDNLENPPGVVSIRSLLEALVESSGETANPVSPMAKYLLTTDLPDEVISNIVVIMNEALRSVAFNVPPQAREQIASMVLAANQDKRVLNRSSVLASVNQLCYHLERSVPLRRRANSKTKR